MTAVKPDAVPCDHGALERADIDSWIDVWRGAVDDAIVEQQIEEDCFEPVHAFSLSSLLHDHAVNFALGAALPDAAAGGALGGAVGWLGSRRCEERPEGAEGCRHMIPVTETLPGAGAAEYWLESSGYRRGDDLVRMVRDDSLRGLPRTDGPTVEEIDEPTEGFAAITGSEHSLPPAHAEAMLGDLPERSSWRCYVVNAVDGLMAGAGATFIAANGVAKLCWDVTMPVCRREGLHRALLVRRVADAILAGCETIFAEVREPPGEDPRQARRNLESVGFRATCVRRLWISPTVPTPIDQGVPAPLA